MILAAAKKPQTNASSAKGKVGCRQQLCSPIGPSKLISIMRSYYSAGGVEITRILIHFKCKSKGPLMLFRQRVPVGIAGNCQIETGNRPIE